MITLAELTALRAARKDSLDLPGSMSERERHAYLAETTVLDQRLAAARTALAILAEVAPELAADTAWLAHLTSWRATLCHELLDIKSPIRDKAVLERADNLTLSIRMIDFGLGASTLGPIVRLTLRIGDLMAAAGYDIEAPALHGPRGWRGAVRETEARIAELTKRCVPVEAQLHEMLLTDDEQATRDAERAALQEVLKTMHIRNNRDGSGLVACTPDGVPLDAADMTLAQRTAFVWAAANS